MPYMEHMGMDGYGIPPWERENHELKSVAGEDMLVPRKVYLDVDPKHIHEETTIY